MSEQLFTIHLDLELGTINRNIYGHFAEHLGRGIYERIWVGEDSSIPNKQGIRLDVVEALKKIKIPVLAGRVDALRMSIIGRMVLDVVVKEREW